MSINKNSTCKCIISKAKQYFTELYCKAHLVDCTKPKCWGSISRTAHNSRA